MISTTFERVAGAASVRRAAWELPAWFTPVLGALVVEVFCLIALGGFVRLMNAGLACPDWPLCFGDYIPDYHPQVYFEFLHRAMAGLVTITTVLLAIALWTSSAPRALKWTMAGAVALLMAQVVFGGLTVLLQLRAGVVATHLAMGTGFFALLLWMSLVAKGVARVEAPAVWLARWTVFVVVCVYAQLLLGGLVASNYAGHVCTEFPACQNGVWFPTFSGMIGIHLIHRLGAYFVFALTFANWLLVRRSSPAMARWSALMFAFVCVQVGLGIANVLLLTPPLIGVAHLATATFVLSVGVRQVYLTRHA